LGQNVLQNQHEEHLCHVDDVQLIREILQDYLVNVEENVIHQHREINLQNEINNFSINKFHLPIAVSGIAIVVVSVAIRNGPCTDKPQPSKKQKQNNYFQ
jgi:hypothetical protein